jgi:hypothetical protein
MDKKGQGKDRTCHLRSEKGRKWIFTSQQPQEIEKHIIEGYFHALVEEAQNRPTYLKIALERGGNDNGKEGNIHLQGYLELHSPTTFVGVQNFLAAAFLRNPHIEFAYAPGRAASYVGNPDFEDEYGEKKKGEILWVMEYGKSTNKQGVETRKGADWNVGLLQMKAAIDNGATVAEIWQSHFLQMIYVSTAIKGYIECRREASWEKENEAKNKKIEIELEQKGSRLKEEEETTK